jgi:peptide/nickel transport system ATP-binding protein
MAFSGPPVLEIDDVSISYRVRAGEVPAVINASLLIRSGEALGLVGESGCGKTTLASAILGHFAGTGRIGGGTIRFRGRDIARLSRQELRRIRGGGIGMVHQDAMSALNPSLTVGEQLAEAVVYHRNTSWTTARSEAASMLSDVRLPDPGRVMEAYPHQLSGGQQQRVVIAMALLARPTLLLLDEPTTALDVTVEAGIIDLIGSLRAKYEMALLYISHNLGVIAQVCGRVAVMYSGEIVEQGPAEAVFASPRHPYTLGLLRCIPQPHLERSLQRLEAIRGQVMVPQKRSPGCLFGQRCRDFRAGVCDHGRIAMEAVEAAPPHQVRCRRWNDIVPSPATGAGSPPAATGTERTAVDVKGLDKEYPVEEPSPWRALTGIARGAIRANQKLSFRARQGQTLAIVGESGCGKTTFAKILTGLETATGGEIRFADLDISRLPVERRPRDLLRALQMVFQNPDDTLNPSFTVGAQIARAVKKLGDEHTRAGIARRTRELLELTHLPAAFASRRPRQLSGGQKQRVGIARAFAGQPQAVVADEPVSALDVSVRAAITELLLDILRRQGTTLIVISHDLGLVRYLADRVVVMYLGQVMEAGSTEQLFNPPYHPYTEALLAAVPIADLRIRKRKIVLSGEVPNPADPPKGCPFHTRCPRKLGAICEEQKPAEQRSPDGHRIACHIPVVELARVEPIFAPASPDTEQ